MGIQKKLWALSVILIVLFVFSTAIQADAKPKDPKRATVTGTATEIVEKNNMLFVHIVPESGEDSWVAVLPGGPEIIQGNVYTFEGHVEKDYKVHILKKKLKKIIFSNGPQ
jgi:hypothetical protein